MKFQIIPPPACLENDVEYIRVAEYSGETALSINVCLNGLPGLAFQHDNGRSPIDHITTPSALVESSPTLFVYGQMTEPSVMIHKPGPFTTIQVILKPYALSTLLGLNASVMTDALVDLNDLSATTLNDQLLEARHQQDRIALMMAYLKGRLSHNRRDPLIEAALHLIHTQMGSITVPHLLQALNVSERHFERRFRQTIGLSPHFYIRIKRFHASIRLMKTTQLSLTDVAHTLNFYDQSHFIRDIKAFSGITPKALSQRIDTFQPDPRIYAY